MQLINVFAYVTSILRTFQSLVDGGKEVTAPQWHRELMKAWSSKVESYFLLASSCGSLDAVEYFIDNGQKPNLRYIDHHYSTLLDSFSTGPPQKLSCNLLVESSNVLHFQCS